MGIKYPHGIYVLCSIELIERLSYCGIQALLVLFLLNVLGISETQSYVIYGAYVGLTFIVSIGAGIVADRILGLQKAICLGGISILLGNIVLVLPSAKTIYLGLSLIILGTGLFKPNCAGLVSALYQPSDRRRDAGYTLYYMWTNIGGLLGPIIYGFIAQQYHWRYAFIISAIGMLIGLFIYQYNKKHFASESSLILSNHFLRWLAYLLFPFVVFLLWQLLLYPQWVGSILNGVAIIIVLALAAYLILDKAPDYFKIGLMAGLILISVGYFSLVFQTSSSLTFFIENYVDRSLFHWQIPAAMFAALEPLFVAIGAPLMTYFWLHYDKQHYGSLTLLKVAAGLLLGGVGFLIFALMAKYMGFIAPMHSAIFFIVLGNVLIGLGELCIAPPILSILAHLVPIKFRGTIMGIYYLALAFSGYLAGLIAKMTSHSALQIATVTDAMQAYVRTYLSLSCCAIVLSLVLFLSAYFIKKQPI